MAWKNPCAGEDDRKDIRENLQVPRQTFRRDKADVGRCQARGDPTCPFADETLVAFQMEAMKERADATEGALTEQLDAMQTRMERVENNQRTQFEAMQARMEGIENNLREQFEAVIRRLDGAAETL